MIGRVLDKYEILEEVGQGGMSVVYKGRDTSLHREVAIKVLHPHLAGHEEARRRFEREAQAVAKLRHENILEIFDYSGKQSTESYIVTEFIKGGTLKDFVTRHKLGFPEIGAMMVAEVCRALEHAHGLGVLHRDVKPENIMIRDDGVLKLMDFGIAQIVDAQRMTVTGQLLGSPAYMSPEHVEGKPLDFRTDVFSVGILLYQLATGELPFKGRNPHEILKRIAECKFIDARVVNPLVGDRLGRIIGRALSREPNDRYQDVSQFLDDLNRYLAEAELDEPRKELSRFFDQPVSYEQALRTRLIAALSKKGKQELAARRIAPALELFNRVLTIDPSNELVLREIDRLSRRRRLARALAFAAAVVVLGAGVVVVVQPWKEPVAEPVAPDAASMRVVANLPPDGGPFAETAPDAAVVAEAPNDAAPTARSRSDGRTVATLKPDAAVLVTSRRITLMPPSMIRNQWRYRLDDGAYENLGSGATIEVAGEHDLTFDHSYCEPQQIHIGPNAPSEITARCVCRSATVIPRCSAASSVTVGDKATGPGTPVPITSFDEKCKARVRVEFVVADQLQSQDVTVVGGSSNEVSCEAQ